MSQHLPGGQLGNIWWPPAVPGPCAPGSANHVLHMPALSDRPDTQRATHG